MNDRELLELSAKAAGIGELVYHSDVERYAVVRMPVGASCNEWAFWNPLVDDGDALRLMASLGLCVSIEDGHVYSGRIHADAQGLSVHTDRIKGAATLAIRKCIVMAAAEIGRSMP